MTLSKYSELFTDSTTLIVFKAISLDDSYYDTTTISKFYDVIDAGDGRNLLLNTSSYRESNPLERTGSKTDDYSTYPKIITSIDLSANQTYTLQAKTDSNWATKHATGGHTPSEKLVGLWLVSDDTNTFWICQKDMLFLLLLKQQNTSLELINIRTEQMLILFICGILNLKRTICIRMVSCSRRPRSTI